MDPRVIQLQPRATFQAETTRPWWVGMRPRPMKCRFIELERPESESSLKLILTECRPCSGWVGGTIE